MNKLIPKIGSGIVAVTVFMFAVFLIAGLSFCYFFVCMILPIGYIMMAEGFRHECPEDRKTAANIGMVLAAVYAVLVLLVYFAQTTTVANEQLNEQAAKILDYSFFGLIFNYDILGYAMMALSTFFIGLSFKAESKADKWLKYLMIIHGVFFLSCFIMPMTGMFVSMGGKESSGGISGGTLALVFWCAYFLPIGILSFLHFGKEK